MLCPRVGSRESGWDVAVGGVGYFYVVVALLAGSLHHTKARSPAANMYSFSFPRSDALHIAPLATPSGNEDGRLSMNCWFGSWWDLFAIIPVGLQPPQVGELLKVSNFNPLFDNAVGVRYHHSCLT